MRVLLLIASLLLTSSAWAYTGTVPPPPLVKGQFVYTVPNDFDPPLIGRAGITQINEAATKLHHPVYVILVNQLPSLDRAQQADANMKRYTESGEDLQAAYAIDRLAEDWATAQPDLFNGESTVFLLSYQPRKFRMLSGARWKNELRLEKTALEPYTAPFVTAIKGSPKDPKGGIIRVMSKYDDAVFDMTDPARVAARAEAERIAAEAARLAQARSNLDEQILALGNALDPKVTPDEYLPTEVGNYRALLEKARSIRVSDVPKSMSDFAKEMKPSVALLLGHIGEKRSVARTEAILSVLTGLGIGAVLIALFLLGRFRFRTYRKLKEDWTEMSQKWADMITSAGGRYVDAYADRSNVVTMKDATGATKKLRDRVTQEIDDIWTGIKALEILLLRCKETAATGSILNQEPLRKALLDMESEFTFDTGEINKDELFGGETKKVRLNPNTFANSLAMRFKANQSDWTRLKEAAKARSSSSAELFPHTTMTLLEVDAEKDGVPREWLSDHPLAGDDASDASVWKTADDLRSTDPLAYKDHIDGLKAQEAKVVARMIQLDALLRQAKKAADETTVPTLDTKLSADDNPTVTYEAAMHAYHNLKGVVAAHAGDKAMEPVRQASDSVVVLFNKVRQQVATAESAIKEVNQAGGALFEQIVKANLTLEQARTTLDRAQKVHTLQGVRGIGTNIKAGEEMIAQAKQSENRGKEMLARGEHLAALRRFKQGQNETSVAQTTLKQVITTCDNLDQEKARFEAKLKTMGDTRAKAQVRLQRFDRGTLPSFNSPTVTSGPQDFGAMLGDLQRQEQEWDRQARAAERRYEEEQERIRAQRAREEAAARRIADEAAELARRASYHHHHSSSSSSWGSSDSSSSSSSSWGSSDSGSSSSGGSSDGGGSSSSGGDW